MKDNRLEEMINDYRNIEIPQELRGIVEVSIRRAKRDSYLEKKRTGPIPLWGKICMGFAAAMFALILLVNTNQNIAYAMEDIPVLGKLVRVVTFSTYENKNRDMSAHIETPEIKVDSEENDSVKQAAEELNKTVKDYTAQVIKQYQEDVESVQGEGREDITVDYDVVTNTDKLFSLRMNHIIVLNSSNITIKIYHINKQSGKMITLPDIFKPDSDYKDVITNEIMRQMREQMAADNDISYFLDMEDMPDWEGISDEANFYFDKDGNLRFVFDKYEVAPGYMGVCEFTIPDEVAKSILSDCYANQSWLQ